jgi:hypothetical protein
VNVIRVLATGRQALALTVRGDSDAAEDTKNRAASSGVGSREEDAGVTSPDFATLSKTLDDGL